MALSLTALLRWNVEPLPGQLQTQKDRPFRMPPCAWWRRAPARPSSCKPIAPGEYTAGNLTPGAYTVQVEKAGFAGQVNKGFVIQVFQTARLDVVLNVGTVTESVQVTSALPLLQSENASVGQVISTQAINELPLNGRNMAQLAIIAPGVTGLNYAQTGTIGSGVRPDELRPGRHHHRGQRCPR